MGHTENNPTLRKQLEDKQGKMQAKLDREQAIRDSMAKKPATDTEVPIYLQNRHGYGREQFKSVAQPVQVQPPVWSPNVGKSCPQRPDCQCGLSICRMS